MSTLDLISEFEQLLGSKPYFSTSRLTKLGLFGSSSAANAAIKRGELIALKISSKRYVIPRSSALNYFRQKLTGDSQKIEEDCENIA